MSFVKHIILSAVMMLSNVETVAHVHAPPPLLDFVRLVSLQSPVDVDEPWTRLRPKLAKFVTVSHVVNVAKSADMGHGIVHVLYVISVANVQSVLQCFPGPRNCYTIVFLVLEKSAIIVSQDQ
jgi:hypothetical protein